MKVMSPAKKMEMIFCALNKREKKNLRWSAERGLLKCCGTLSNDYATPEGFV
jgi:hypothetical protein